MPDRLSAAEFDCCLAASACNFPNWVKFQPVKTAALVCAMSVSVSRRRCTAMSLDCRDFELATPPSKSGTVNLPVTDPENCWSPRVWMSNCFPTAAVTPNFGRKSASAIFICERAALSALRAAFIAGLILSAVCKALSSVPPVKASNAGGATRAMGWLPIIFSNSVRLSASAALAEYNCAFATARRDFARLISVFVRSPKSCRAEMVTYSAVTKFRFSR